MDRPFRIALALIMATFVAHRGYYSRTQPPVQEETVEEHTGGLLSALASIFAVVGMIALLLYSLAPRRVAWASLRFPGWLRWSGLGVAAGGFALLQWAHAALAANWSDTPRITEQQQLVTAGPYRRVRHPIYTAFLLILSAPLLIASNWLVGLPWLVMTALEVSDRIRFEEARLEARFGDEYRGWAQQTGALLPRL